MTAEHLPADEPFFAQWAARGSKPRTLDSARALGDLLDLAPPLSLAVVGSKGKGTAAAAASMALAAAGLTTISITSPAYRSNRERIRHCGAALSHEEYRRVSSQLAALLPHLPKDHYLSPAGAFTMMGAWWASEIGADALVVEEGMGGATDEVSLLDHAGLAVTEIFDEHAGVIGNDLESIAANLIGAGSDRVQFIASARQAPEVDRLVREAAAAWNAALVTAPRAPHRNPLIGENIGLGTVSGTILAEALGRAAAPVGELNLPGRSSLHDGPSGRWFVDAAISPAGVAAALAASPLERPTVIASWPLSKDRAGCSALVPDAVHVSVPGLDYPMGLPSLDDVLPGLEGDMLALGTISFIAQVLDRLKVPTDLW